jgi:hypothetical protein
MPVDDFDAVAKQIAGQVRISGSGFLTMRREELRAAFQIGRFTTNLSDRVVEALEAIDIMVHPFPSENCYSLRLYELRHPIGQAAHAVIAPDESTDAPLRRLAELQARAHAGTELRSDDVPWIEAFDLLLQVSIGREPDGWEELRDDRHGSMLARELAQALGLSPNVAAASWFLRLAAAVCAGRPRAARLSPDAIVAGPDAVRDGAVVVQLLEERDAALRDSHHRTLEAAARAVLGAPDLPSRQVELGVLKLRRRVEDAHDH